MYLLPLVLGYALLWLLSTQMVRTLLLICAGLFSLFLFFRRRTRQGWAWFAAVAVLLLGGNLFRTQMATAQFFCLERFYQEAADDYCLSLQNSGDIRWDTGRGPFLLSNGGAVQMSKGNGVVSLYFPISESFFNSYGFIYCSEPGAGAVDSPFSLDQCDYAVVLTDHWAYVKLY
jgi:hypothetical protein